MVIANFRFLIANFNDVGPQNRQSAFGNRQLLRLFVTSVFAATAAELAEFQPIGRGLLILGRHVIPTLAILTLKHNIIAWHNSIHSLYFVLCTLISYLSALTKHQAQSTKLNYSTISDTVPAPTVRPPSRIANRNPFSIAIGAINSIDICTLSPGITISTPSGKCATPVTSVVRK